MSEEEEQRGGKTRGEMRNAGERSEGRKNAENRNEGNKSEERNRAEGGREERRGANTCRAERTGAKGGGAKRGTAEGRREGRRGAKGGGTRRTRAKVMRRSGLLPKTWSTRTGTFQDFAAIWAIWGLCFPHATHSTRLRRQLLLLLCPHPPGDTSIAENEPSPDYDDMGRFFDMTNDLSHTRIGPGMAARRGADRTQSLYA